MNKQQACYQRLQATNKLLADILADNAEFIKTGGWISVDDELPAKYEDVLVWNGCNISVSAIETFHENGGWITAFEDEEVTHWQPLPQPPKANQE